VIVADEFVTAAEAWARLVKLSLALGDEAEAVRRLRGARLFVPSAEWQEWA
jgi:hypothetical protein